MCSASRFQILSDEKKALDANPWVQQLILEQHLDGSWGRFHSPNSTSRQKIISTEFSIDRGLALGLDASHPAFCRVVDYLTQLLSGQRDFPDPAERNDRWPVGVGLFSAAALALLKPNHPFLDHAWDLWAEIAARAFKNGDYDAEAEIQAHHNLTGATIKDSYLLLNNKYALTLLSARIDDLPETLFAQIVAWVWNYSQGIRYLGVSPAKLPVDMNPGILDRWFSTHELLSRFPTWCDLAGDVIDWLLMGMDDDGFWDFGPRRTGSYYFPLSPNWRKAIYRKFDWSTRVLVLLSRYQTGQI